MLKLDDMLREYLSEAVDDAEIVTKDDVANYMSGIDAEVYNAGNARNSLSKLTKLAESGAAAVIADRSQIHGLTDTTLMLSAETLAQIIRNVIVGEHARHANREPASALLAGLSPTSPGLGNLAIERLPGDEPGVGAEHVDILGNAAMAVK